LKMGCCMKKVEKHYTTTKDTFTGGLTSPLEFSTLQNLDYLRKGD